MGDSSSSSSNNAGLGDPSASDSSSAASSSDLAAARSSGRVGKVLDGRYLLERLLGEGGMGTVYRAHHMAMDRAVAVKVLRGSLAGDPVAARRFALEAKATTKVDSPHAVKVFDFGFTAEGEYFMVMEYLDGRTAQRELDVDGPMELRRALHVARQALAGLGAAHAVGVIHRDIKPENLLLMRVADDPDVCKVLDFGVAKLMVQTAAPGTALTRDGMVFGTPEFMSPEQACGQPLDGRSDLYSLAATLFTLLTGKALFTGRSAMEVLSKHVTAAPPRLTDQRGLHHLHALDQVLQRALAKKPGDRQRDAAELSRELAFLLPASAPASLAASPTVSTPALPVAGTTPDSPLGVVPPGHGAELSALPTGATPLHFGFSGGEPLSSLPPSSTPGASAQLASLEPGDSSSLPPVAMPTGFRPAATGYLPMVTPDMVPSTQAVLQASAPKRRWAPMAGLAAIFAVALGGVAIWKRAEPNDSSAAKPVTAAVPAPVAPTPPVETSNEASNHAPPVETSPVAEPTPDEPPAPEPKPDAKDDAKDDGKAERVAADRRKARDHISAARAAQRESNNLRQLTQADLALKLAPRDPEALFLLGDAQLNAGDPRGCKTLARLGSSAKAKARAAKASCP